jgi:hypothetical protein
MPLGVGCFASRGPRVRVPPSPQPQVNATDTRRPPSLTCRQPSLPASTALHDTLTGAVRTDALERDARARQSDRLGRGRCKGLPAQRLGEREALTAALWAVGLAAGCWPPTLRALGRSAPRSARPTPGGDPLRYRAGPGQVPGPRRSVDMSGWWGRAGWYGTGMELARTSGSCGSHSLMTTGRCRAARPGRAAPVRVASRTG